MQERLRELSTADTWPKRLTLFLAPFLLVGVVGGYIADQVGDAVVGAPGPAERVIPGR